MDDSLSRISEFWCELHSYKYFFTWEDDKQLIETVNSFGLQIYDWDSIKDKDTFNKEVVDRDRMFKMYKQWNDRGLTNIKIDEIKW